MSNKGNTPNQVTQKNLPFPKKLDNVVMGDIPQKYFDVQDLLPAHAMVIDATF